MNKFRIFDRKTLTPRLYKLSKRIGNLFSAAATFLATGFGIGLVLPEMRGTAGAALALPFLSFFMEQPFAARASVVVVLFVISIVTSSMAEKRFGTKDDNRIVIDEFASIFATFVAIKIGPSQNLLAVAMILASGFVLNRLFDIMKPYPAKKAEDLPSGLGISLDDMISGIYAGIVLFLTLGMVSGFRI